MSYSYEELLQIEATVGEREGWDFSRVRDGRDPVPWDYLHVVHQYLEPDDAVLDVGTGGGERFLSLASEFASGHGIDLSDTMIQTAQANRAKSDIEHVRFSVMDASNLEFEEDSFDVVLNRQSIIDVDEVMRVLRSGGHFIAQAVGHRNTRSIFNAFGWTMQSFDEQWLTLAETAKLFQEQGASLRAFAEYAVPYWFEDVESLVFWLKAVPLPVPFDMNIHWQQVNQILATCSTSRGIETNEHRELLIVQKA